MKKIKKIAILMLICSLLYGCAKPAEQALEQPTEQISEQLTQQVSEQATQPTNEQPSEEESVSETIVTETSPSSENTPLPESSQTESESPSNEPILTAKVPESLQTLLANSFLKGTTSETLNPLISNVLVTQDEYELYRNCGVDDALSDLEYYGGILLRVDADNDSLEDLFFWIKDGGSLGNSTFCLAKGNADGNYEVTEYQETLSQEAAFINFEGQNYLVETDFEYNRKAVNGFIITCYEQGQTSDRVYLEATVSTWNSTIVSCDPAYQTLASQYAERGKDGFHDDDMYDYRVDAGSGERVEKVEETIYYADINNDGTEEWYTKYIFYPSSIGSYICIENKLYFSDAPEQAELLTSYYDLQYNGRALTFWVETITDDTNHPKHIVCLLTYEGLNTNYIYGYFIEGESVTEVFEIEYEGQLKFQ